ncbi:MAG: cytidylate kinase-like family protein [Anaerolineae bacterium]|nr:cytidylate kinase-like family protein [Anaerolineae bacterium]
MSLVITISRQLGSRGSYIAAEVARRMELRYLDREILQRAAEKAGYPDEAMIQQLEQWENMPGPLEKILMALGTMPLTPTIASASLREGYVYDERIATLMLQKNFSRDEAYQRLIEEEQRAEAGEDYVELVQQVIKEYAKIGDTVIVGRGGQIILCNAPHTLHVRIEAPKDIRIQNMIQRLGVDEKEAERRILRSDKLRARYLKQLYNAAWNDPTLYHMILNTGKLSESLATHVICEAACQLRPQVPL